MSQLVELLKDREANSGLPRELFAHQIGLKTSSTLYHYYNGTREVGVKAARNLASYFSEQGDTEMVHALASYLLQVEIPLE